MLQLDTDDFEFYIAQVKGITVGFLLIGKTEGAKRFCIAMLDHLVDGKAKICLLESDLVLTDPDDNVVKFRISIDDVKEFALILEADKTSNVLGVCEYDMPGSNVFVFPEGQRSSLTLRDWPSE